MSPRRTRKPVFLYFVCIMLIGAGIYLSFELGRYEAGYSVVDQRRQVEAFEQTVAARDETIEELRRQQAIFETSREIDRETYAQVEANLSQLQEQIQAQEEELAFYRGIVSPQDGMVGLRIQNLEILPANSEQHHLLRLILVQAIVHSQRVTGVVQVKLAGNIGDELAEFDLDQLVVDGGSDSLAYGFRYFQSFEQELVLPVGFEPDTVEVQILPSSPRGEPVTQSFKWSVISS